MASFLDTLKNWLFGPPTVTSPSPLPGMGEGQFLQDSPDLFKAPTLHQGYLAACVGASIWGMIQTMSRGQAPKTPSYDKLYWEGTREILHKVGWNAGTFVVRMLNYLDYELDLAEDSSIITRKPGYARWSIATQIIEKLYEGRPVGLAILWTRGMSFPVRVKCKDGSTIPVLEWIDTATGGHCVYIVKRAWFLVENPDKKARKETPWVRAPFIKIQNSYGDDWGEQGCAWIREQEFGRIISNGYAEAFTFDINPKWWSPTTTPETV